MAHLVIYGGSFNPIHYGHLRTCRAAKELLGADRVLILPARVSPHKLGEPPGASDAQRLAMLRLAVEGDPGFVVDARELSRPGPSYTVDTVRALKREFPGDRFTLLIGADQLPKLHTWREVGRLLEEVDPAVMGRPGAELEAGFAQVGEHLGAEQAKRLRGSHVNTPLVDISSTEIRRRVREGLPIDGLTPEPVAAYIREQGLYRS